MVFIGPCYMVFNSLIEQGHRIGARNSGVIPKTITTDQYNSLLFLSLGI